MVKVIQFLARGNMVEGYSTVSRGVVPFPWESMSEVNDIFGSRGRHRKAYLSVSLLILLLAKPKIKNIHNIYIGSYCIAESY